MTRTTMGRGRRSLAAALALVLFAGAAFAQDTGQPSPEEIKAKILEVEKLMKKAEAALARSTGAGAVRRDAEAAAAAKRIEDLLDKKAQQQAGKSADELRKEAAEGSEDAAELLKKLTGEAQTEAEKAAQEMEKVLGEGGRSSGEAEQGIRKLLEETEAQGRQVTDGIQWLLDNAIEQGSGSGDGGGDGSGGGGEPAKKQDKGGDPKDGGQKSPTPKKPESELDPPRTPEFEIWLADLPPQVRKAYQSGDWDGIPPKWRRMVEAWTEKLAREFEEDRR